MWKADSFEKTLMLGKIEGRRRRGRHRRDGWMASPTQCTWVWVELVMDREAWHAAVHGVTKSWIRLIDWTELNYCLKAASLSLDMEHIFVLGHRIILLMVVNSKLQFWCSYRRRLSSLNRSHPQFRCLVHFVFFFVYGIRKYSNLTLLYVVFQFSQHHWLNRLSFLLCILASFVKHKVLRGFVGLSLSLYLVPLVYISVQYHFF